MARTGITSEQVGTAADAIKARGGEPTITAVRAELGNIGSYSTISGHMTTWRNAQASHQVTPRPAPPEIEQQALQLASAVWSAAINQAEQSAVAAREQADEHRRHCDAAVFEAHAEIAQLEHRIEELNQVVAELHTAREFDATRTENILNTRDEARTDLARLRGAHDELKRAYDSLLQRVDRMGQSPVDSSSTTPPATATPKTPKTPRSRRSPEAKS